jgi:hypothetical protein
VTTAVPAWGAGELDAVEEIARLLVVADQNIRQLDSQSSLRSMTRW